jgi:cholesterol transport system auxiliary component
MNDKGNRMKQTILAILTLMLFSGCSIKETSLKPYSYTLEPMLKLERFSEHNKDVLKVAYIDAPSGLNTRAILYKKEGSQSIIEI